MNQIARKNVNKRERQKKRLAMKQYVAAKKAKASVA